MRWACADQYRLELEAVEAVVVQEMVMAMGLDLGVLNECESACV